MPGQSLAPLVPKLSPYSCPHNPRVPCLRTCILRTGHDITANQSVEPTSLLPIIRIIRIIGGPTRGLLIQIIFRVMARLDVHIIHHLAKASRCGMDPLRAKVWPLLCGSRPDFERLDEGYIGLNGQARARKRRAAMARRWRHARHDNHDQTITSSGQHTKDACAVITSSGGHHESKQR